MTVASWSVVQGTEREARMSWKGSGCGLCSAAEPSDASAGELSSDSPIRECSDDR